MVDKGVSGEVGGIGGGLQSVSLRGRRLAGADGLRRMGKWLDAMGI